MFSQEIYATLARTLQVLRKLPWVGIITRVITGLALAPGNPDVHSGGSVEILSKLAKVVPAGWRSQVLETLKRQYGLGWPIALTSHPGSELDLLDVVLAHYANQNRRTRFLQVGAADGVMGDPLFPLIEQYSMEGVLIEPRRETYERLKENYARRFRKGFVFVNAAIMRSDGTQNFYSIKPDAEGPIGWRERPASTRASCFKRFDSLAILSR